jgi:hypothetical protein
MPNDDGNLLLSLSQRNEIVTEDERSARFIKAFTGTDEFIDGVDKFAIWISGNEHEEALSVPVLEARIERVRLHRSKSSRAATKRLAATPWRFAEIRYRETYAIVIPRHSSERREYIPIGYLGPESIIGDSASAVYGAEPWVFALLTSRMHMAWVRAVGGALETRIRYSNTIVYNNFPVPPVADAVKAQLSVAALRVLDVREYHCEKNLAELYDPDLMPADLREAHARIDALVDSIYSERGYETDEQRLSDLFALYEAMTSEEAAKAPARARGAKK